MYPIELKHPDLLQHFFTRSRGKPVRGWYAWKPVAIKQALDMFPYILFLDAGCRVLQPLDNIFYYIKKKHYLLVENGSRYSIGDHCTKHVTDLFALSLPERKWILAERSISAGIQGLSRIIFGCYVQPMYELSKDLKNFQDDGSSPLGFGFARHDQTLFSILRCLLNWELIPPHRNNIFTVRGRRINICISDKDVKDRQIAYHSLRSQNYTQFNFSIIILLASFLS